MIWIRDPPLRRARIDYMDGSIDPREAVEHRRRASEFRRLARCATVEWVRRELLACAAAHDEKAALCEQRCAPRPSGGIEAKAVDAGPPADDGCLAKGR
jgi:hypothetical protein